MTWTNVLLLLVILAMGLAFEAQRSYTRWAWEEMYRDVKMANAWKREAIGACDAKIFDRHRKRYDEDDESF